MYPIKFEMKFPFAAYYIFQRRKLQFLDAIFFNRLNVAAEVSLNLLLFTIMYDLISLFCMLHRTLV